MNIRKRVVDTLEGASVFEVALFIVGTLVSLGLGTVLVFAQLTMIAVHGWWTASASIIVAVVVRFILSCYREAQR